MSVTMRASDSANCFRLHGHSVYLGLDAVGHGVRVGTCVSPGSRMPEPWTVRDVRDERSPTAGGGGDAVASAPDPAAAGWARLSLHPGDNHPEQREQLGEQIQRYCHATLAWCLHAVAAADPRAGLERTSSRGPAEELRFRLTRSINMSNAGMPSLDELSKPQDFAMVESRRQVARAAVLGEHDFPGSWTTAGCRMECVAVLTGAAEVARALVVLDKRSDNIPGWIPIRERARLDRAAEARAVFAQGVEPDYSVDQKAGGSRLPPSTGVRYPASGVLQAEHNMLVHLARFPDALNLRRVMDGQRILSHEAARLAPNVAPELIEGWLEREQTYKRLIDETRNVGGLIGNGGPATAEAVYAIGRFRRLYVDEITSPEPLRDLDKLFTRTDARVAVTIEQGVAERLYFVSVKLPRIVVGTDQLLSPTRERYVTINSPVQTDLLAITRHQLEPPPVAPAAPPGVHESREGLRELVGQRPERRSGPSR